MINAFALLPLQTLVSQKIFGRSSQMTARLMKMRLLAMKLKISAGVGLIYAETADHAMAARKK